MHYLIQTETAILVKLDEMDLSMADRHSIPFLLTSLKLKEQNHVWKIETTRMKAEVVKFIFEVIKTVPEMVCIDQSLYTFIAEAVIEVYVSNKERCICVEKKEETRDLPRVSKLKR
jgi:hypothetical protein